MKIPAISLITLLSLVAPLHARPTLTVGEKGADGRPGLVTVETTCYKIVFDRVAQGGAVSALHKKWNLNLRSEDFYSAAMPLFNPFVLKDPPDPETGLICFERQEQVNRAQSKKQLAYAEHEVLKHSENELVLEFTWQKRGRAPAWHGKLIRRKRLTFRDDSPAIRVEFELENTDKVPHPVVAVFANSTCLGDVNVVPTAMMRDGLFRALDAKTVRYSSNLPLPDIAGQFIGGVAETGNGVGYAYDWADLDAFKMDNYKERGFASLAFMRRRTIQPGETITYPCTFMTFNGLPVLEGMVEDLAGGLTVEIKQGEPSPLAVSLVSGSSRRVAVTIRCKRLEDGAVILDEAQSLDLAVGEAQQIEAAMNVIGNGTYALAVRADDGAGTVLRMERGIRVGETKAAWAPTPPPGEKRGAADASAVFATLGLDKAFRDKEVRKYARASAGDTANISRRLPVLRVTPSRKEAVYDIGEKAAFAISLASRDGKPVAGEAPVKVWGETIQVGADPVTVEREITRPGFVRCTALMRTWGGKRTYIKAQATVAGAPEKIEPVVTMPDDFDAFWEEGRKRLADIPLDYRQERVDILCNEKHDIFKVSFANINDTRIYGYLLIPKTGKKKTYPALVAVASAGTGKPRPDFILDRLNSLSTDQAIGLYMGVYDHDLGRPPAYYKNYTYKDGTPSRATGDREAYFLRRAILGIDRAINWLASRPDVDASRIVYTGSSQGGGMGLIMTGLNKHIAAVNANIPAFCDHLSFLAGRQPGYPGILGRRKRGKMADEKIEALKKMLPYFDAVNFARKIRVPVLMSVGFQDTTCPASGGYAAYNTISAPKQMVGDPTVGHAVSASTRAVIVPWVRSHLGLGKRPEPKKVWEK